MYAHKSGWIEDDAFGWLRLRLEIAGKYDLLPASVYAAIAYYFDHKEEIDGRIKEDDAFVEEFRRNNPDRLQEKLRMLRGE